MLKYPFSIYLLSVLSLLSACTPSIKSDGLADIPPFKSIAISDFSCGNHSCRAQSPHFSIQTDFLLTRDSLQQLADRLEHQYQRVRHFGFGADSSAHSFQVRFLPNIEAMGLQSKQAEAAFIEPTTGQLLLVADPAFYTAVDIGVADLVTPSLDDTHPNAFMRAGFIAYLTRGWQGADASTWAARWAKTDYLPSITQIQSGALADNISPLAVKAALGSWVDFLVKTTGKEATIQYYTDKAKHDPADKHTAWQRFLAKAYTPPEKMHINHSLRGFNFAHEGYDIDNGYTGQKVHQVLKRMANIGATSQAIVPYSYLRSPELPGPIPLIDYPQAENDGGLIHTAAVGMQYGLTPILKPQIYIHQHWPGAVNMKDSSDWVTFFHNYERWILHYAMLAQSQNIPVLVIGTEFAEATKQHPQRWRSMIEHTRELYGGQLTYAANWGDEYENFTFWDALDIVSVNCYYPLSKNPDARMVDLQAGAEKVIQRILNAAPDSDQPIWITELGFRSVQQPWLNPHAAINGRASDETAQANCYKALLSAIQKAPRIQGQYWWKWPSHASHADQEGGFTPLGKQAEGELATMWLR